MSAIDYKVEADENLEMALKYPDGYQHLSTSQLIALAQANATIALAEQQRIANLLAFVASVQSGVTTELPSETVMRRAESAGAQIVEGLNLS